MKYFYSALLALWMLFNTAAQQAFAQIDTIDFARHRLHTENLKPGLRQYLIYYQTPAASRSLRFWFWLRDVKKEVRAGKAMFVITQHWYGSDTSAYRHVYSVNRAADFAPVYHREDSKGKVMAYNWNEKQITGADSVAGNAQRTFSLGFNVANFNWNLDIETFEMLPLAAGKTFAINFYDAGLIPPAYVVYKVIGSEVMLTLDRRQVDCWKLQTTQTNNGILYVETYWISKKNHEFLKEEDAFNGMYRYKIKMPALSPNLLNRFTKQ